jgi:hypothetical protein
VPVYFFRRANPVPELLNTAADFSGMWEDLSLLREPDTAGEDSWKFF